MLPRVRNALTKFISPIASTQNSTQAPVHEGTHRDGKGGKNQNPDKPHLTLIQGGKVQETSSGSVPAVQKSPAWKSAAHTATLTFLNLFRAIRDQQSSFVSWMGKATYQKITRKKNRIQVKRGAMIDQKLE